MSALPRIRTPRELLRRSEMCQKATSLVGRSTLSWIAKLGIEA